MKNKKSQSGNVHAIFVVIAFIALLGGLGFIFWQNFLNSKETNQSHNSQTATKPADNPSKSNSLNEAKLTEVISDQTAGTNLALKYPKSWRMTKDSTTPMPRDIFYESYKISSPDNKIVVNFVISNIPDDNFFKTCEKSDGDELLYIKKESLSAFSNAEYEEFYISTAYFAGISQNDKLTGTTNVGDSVCNTGPDGLMPIKNTKNIKDMILSLDIEFPEIEYSSKSSVEKFKEIIKTDDYKTAKSIVKSIHAKN